MRYEFVENTLIIINWTYKDCRLREGEALRFLCTFNTIDGVYVHSVDLEEINKEQSDSDGQFSLLIDATEKKILPGRYSFEVLHMVDTGQAVSLINQYEGIIEIIPSAFLEQKSYRAQELYSGLPYRNDDYEALRNVPEIDGTKIKGDITSDESFVDNAPTKGSKKLLTSGVVFDFLEEKSEKDHKHKYEDLSGKPKIAGTELTNELSLNEIMFRKVLTSSDDCDKLFDDGWYVYSTSSLPANAPFPNAGVIEVFGVDSTSSQKIQRAYRYGVAGYSAFRPLYNSAWGSWSYPLISSSNANSPVADYVVEEGTSGNWNYRKWFSGKVEAWGEELSLTVTAKSTVSAINGMSVLTAECKFPSVVLADSNKAVEYYMLSAKDYRFIGNMSSVSNNNIWGRFYTYTSFADSFTVDSSTIKASAMLIGKWK